MIDIAYPPHPYKIKEEGGREIIFDEIRKQWLVLTPEEWVRQNFIQYLVQAMQYPATLMAVEKEIQVGGMRRRCDIVVYRDAMPWMIVECKEMKVPLTTTVLRQVLNYNVRLQVAYLVITNGTTTYAASISGERAEWITAIPTYK
ncbi:type I restriction enzyme HsdR N-terminal domain-containing protein [Segetibacter sp. 3557_3]|uniref:type I restriction enzyme HsdR N-terminal domain-containing protein n=1 Tax=Segetibacter sp. 3557_3 TaxID=2547429 RepID=UPI001058C52C|nr:type I restriction enzyme HsdR N-terminal domain-containing protein [Segetibacter sp. 3557_3]TDH27903.1 type I restriction enzyme HsdR N-terminal domain-containing protein [Segetibacter sp. 3557_3]